MGNLVLGEAAGLLFPKFVRLRWQCAQLLKIHGYSRFGTFTENLPPTAKLNLEFLNTDTVGLVKSLNRDQIPTLDYCFQAAAEIAVKVRGREK
jgi:hypothetical protein